MPSRTLASRPALQLWAAFAASRALLIAVMLTSHSTSLTLWEVSYFRAGLSPDSDAMREYPVTLVWVTALFDWVSRLFSPITGTSVGAAVAWFTVLTALFDVLFFAWLARSSRRRGAWFWVVAGLALGPLLWSRFDIICGSLTALALGWVARRPKVASALLGVATTVKLWPGLLGAVLVGPGRQKSTWVRIATFCGTIGVIVGLQLTTSGLDRLLSIFEYQGDRGLQIESIMASIPMLLHSVTDKYQVAYATSKSFEITGPGVGVLITAADVLLLSGVAAVFLYCLVRLARTHQPSATSVMAWGLVLIGGILITDKVLSPQYILWLIMPVAAVIDSLWSSSRSWRTISLLCIVATALTQAVYPLGYNSLLHGDLGTTIVLVVRNLCLVAIWVLCVRQWLRLTEPHAAREVRASVIDRVISHPLFVPLSWAAGVHLVVQFVLAAVVGIVSQVHDSTLWARMALWDSGWFRRLATYGYGGPDISFQPAEYSSTAFFPFTGWALKLVHGLFPTLSWGAAGCLMNILPALACSLLAAVIVCHLTDERHWVVVSAMISAVVSAWPMSVTFLMAYSEAFFTCAVLLFIAAVLKQQWWLAASALLWAGLIRVTAVALMVAFGLVVALKYRTNLKAWIAVCISPLTVGGYILWASSKTAAVGGYFGVQSRGWGTHFDGGVDLVTQTLETVGIGYAGLDISFAIILFFIGLLVAATVLRIPVVMWLVGAGIGANILGTAVYYSSRPRLLLTAGIVLMIGVLARVAAKNRWVAGVLTVLVAASGIAVSTYMMGGPWTYVI